MKPPKLPKNKPADAKKINRAMVKEARKFKRNSREVEIPGINPIQRSSMKLNYKRVSTEKFKPMQATYGTSKRGKGATVTRIAKAK